MSREKNLVKNTLIITIGKICTQLISFFLLPIYTGILTTAEYGIVDLLNTLVYLLLPIVTFQIDQGVFRELIEVRDNAETKSKVISTAMVTVTFQCIIYSFLYLVISPFIHNQYKLFFATNVITAIYLSLFMQISRGLGDNKTYAVGSFITVFSTIIFNILFLVVIKLGANGMLLATMSGQVVASIYYFISLKLYKYIKMNFYKKETLKKLLKYSIPLIPNAISWWVFSSSDRVIVTSILGVDQNGILAVSLKFSSVMIAFYNIFNVSWTESIAISINDKDIDKYFNKMFDIVLRLFVSIALGIIACMPFVFPIMINEKYMAGYGLVPVSIIASLFYVVVGLVSVIYVAKKNTKAIANTSIFSAIINIVVHLALIEFVGLYAAVISTFVAYFAMSIFRIIDIKKKYFAIQLHKKEVIVSVIAFAIVCMSYYINNLYINIISLIIAILFGFLINKDSIKTIINMVNKKIKKSKV